MFFSHKKERGFDTCHDTDEPGEHYPPWRTQRPHSRWFHVCEISRIGKCRDRVQTGVKQELGTDGGGWVWEALLTGHRLFWGYENVLELEVCLSNPVNILNASELFKMAKLRFHQFYLKKEKKGQKNRL